MRTTAILASGVMTALLAASCSPTAPMPSPTSSPAPTTTSAAEASTGPAATSVASTVPSATSFTEPLLGHKSGRLQLSTVLTADGTAVAGAPVTIELTALGNTYQVLTLKGVVPKPAKSVIVQLGFNNQPDTGPAEYDVRIYRITYADGGKTRNRLPNGRFDSGLYRWAVYGEGTVTTPTSELDDGRLLRLRASPDEEIVINSYGIPVAPESAYTMTVTAQVPPSGSVSGYVAAIFLKETEIWRETLKVVGAPLAPFVIVTGGDGSISVNAPVPAGQYRVKVSFAGDATHLPAVAEQEITVG